MRSSRKVLAWGWWLYSLLVILLAILPFVASLPAPPEAKRLDHAMFTGQDASTSVPVRLPHRWPADSSATRQVSYELDFVLSAVPSESLYLYVPNLKRTAKAWLKGVHIYDSEARHSWAGALVQTSDLTALPTSSLRPGNNALVLELQSAGPLPSQLSALYVGRLDELVPYYKRRVWINEHLLAMSYAVQVVLALGMLTAFSMRRRETSFAWLGLTLGLGASFGSAILAPVLPDVQALYPLVFLLGPSIGGASVLFALSLLKLPEWRTLKLWVAAAPFLLYALALTGALNVGQVSVLIAIPALILGAIASSFILLWGAWRQRAPEAKWIVGPWSLITLYTLHDLALTLGGVDSVSFVNPSGRTLFMTVIVMIMMKNLSASLSAVERSGEVLEHRLAEQQKRLDANHAEQTLTVRQEAIEYERQRLTSDLHDGLGSYLTSILALSERPNPANADIHLVARNALNDLRMVLFSLDSDGSDLNYVLAVYRQHVGALLSNMGIGFEWSMARLPDIKGIGPSKVLSVLRILQEAVTNAYKHGDPKRMVIRGEAGADQTALLIIENHGGVPYEKGPHQGYGLSNMHKRAMSLGSSTTMDALPDGARFVLRIPIDLSAVASS